MIRHRTLIVCFATAALGFHDRAVAQDDVTVKTGASGKRITLYTDKSDIGKALSLIAEHGGLNLVVGPGVEGTITVALEDVPVDVALRAITIHNGFNYTVDEGVITISAPSADQGAAKPPPTVTRSFVLRSVDALAIKKVLQHILTPSVGNMEVLPEDSQPIHYMQNINDLSGNFKNSGTGASGTASQSGGANQGGAGGGSLIQQSSSGDEHSRTLIVTDVEEVVDRIASLIADLDRAPPQVLIEARLVEMSTILQRELGIDWNLEVFANGPILNHELPIRWRAGFASGGQIRRTQSGLPQSIAGLALGAIDFTRLSAVLRANQDDNAVRLLANPRMLIRNNHPASILVGERYPIFEANITDFGTVTEAFDTYIPIGIQLDIKPTIMPDGRISSYIHAAISSLGDDVVGTTGLRVARINTREVSTRIIMRDGQTVVIGGLISDRKVRSVSKVPFLGDIPILSALFRHENPRSERVDLLVFLTAHVQGAVEMNKRDREIFDKYRPHFKHVEQLQDVPLHFEIPTEYAPPRPMFGDPPAQPPEDEIAVLDETPYRELPAEPDRQFGVFDVEPDSAYRSDPDPVLRPEPAPAQHVEPVQYTPVANEPAAPPVMRGPTVWIEPPPQDAATDDETTSAGRVDVTENARAMGDTNEDNGPNIDADSDDEPEQGGAPAFYRAVDRWLSSYTKDDQPPADSGDEHGHAPSTAGDAASHDDADADRGDLRRVRTVQQRDEAERKSDVTGAGPAARANAPAAIPEVP